MSWFTCERAADIFSRAIESPSCIDSTTSAQHGGAGSNFVSLSSECSLPSEIAPWPLSRKYHRDLECAESLQGQPSPLTYCHLEVLHVSCCHQRSVQARVAVAADVSTAGGRLTHAFPHPPPCRVTKPSTSDLTGLRGCRYWGLGGMPRLATRAQMIWRTALGAPW